MVDLISLHTYHSRNSFLSPSTMISRSSDHRRSSSSGTRSPSPDRTITKAKSSDGLSRFMSEKAAPAVRSTSVGELNDGGFSTLRDPRNTTSSEESETSSPLSHHPDLNDEVAALSVKLVQAINNQTNLDDTLVATRQELEQAQTMVKTLKSQNEKYQQDIDQQVLIKKADSDAEVSRLQDSLLEERSLRIAIEKEKKTIEQELETLTAALFEEANKMVAAAKLDREEVEKKNDQLRTQIKDTEALVASQQDQLAELKAVMQDMGPKDDVDAAPTTPSSPAASRQTLQGVSRKGTGMTEHSEQASPNLPEDLSPGPSTSFQHLIKSVCRTDVQAFEDFRELFSTPSSKSSSRAPSGTYSGLNVISLTSFGGGGFGSASSSPSKSQPHSPNGSMSSTHPGSQVPLKETRFYKRALLEDIEPTLRLDLAPSISWLTRRTVLSGICEGTLQVEPTMPALYDPCSMCGERRSDSEHERCHLFRTSDSDTAQRYPLCGLCLHRVRSCCEFTGYLRLIRGGHVRVGDVEEEKEVWEETVRLREAMFWSRIGGGVVPMFSQVDGTPALPSQIDGPSTQESTGVQTEVQTETDIGRDDYYLDDDSERGSIYEDPFVSAGSASPASSVADSTMPDQLEPLDLDNMTEEVYEPGIDQVTISAIHDSKDTERPSSFGVASRDLTMFDAGEAVHQDTSETAHGQ